MFSPSQQNIHSDQILKECLYFSFTECKNIVKGTEFRGTSFTEAASGAKCQRWDQDSPHDTDLNDDPTKMVELGLRGKTNRKVSFYCGV